MAPPLFLFDARRDSGKSFKTLFPVFQANPPAVAGKSRMAEADWAKGGGRDCIRLSSPGYPSGPSPLPGIPWYERVQMGDKRTMTIGERCCYAIGFRIKQGQDIWGQDLASEIAFQSVAARGPSHSLKVVNGAVQYWLSAGETTPTSVVGPAFEVNTGKARVKNMGTQYAIPASIMSYGGYHRVLIDTLLRPDWTGWVAVHHKVDGGLGWLQTVSLQGIPTLQCVKDGKRTVPSLLIMDLFNLYCIAKPGAKERDYDLFGRFDSAQSAKAWIK